jgi:urease accessory protein
MTRCLKLSFATFVVLSVTGFSTAAFAHPGHAGGFAGGLVHPLTGLDHLLAMVAVGLWASQLGRRAMLLLPVLFPAVMAVGAALGVYGVTLPWVEAGILASVVTLGAVIALGLQPSLAVSAGLVGLFALFHGHAHGTELPVQGSALVYGVGFIAATLALHLVGIGIGMFARYPVALRTAGGAIAACGVALLILK